MYRYFTVMFFMPLYLLGISSDCNIIQEDFPLIHGIVDPMKGKVSYHSVGHIIKGKEPIVINKSYSNDASTKRFHGGWFLFPEIYLLINEGVEFTKDYEIKRNYFGPEKAEISIYDYNNDHHRFVYHKSLENKTYQYKSVTNEEEDCYRNTQHKEISARTNPCNMKLVIDWEKHAVLTKGDGSEKHYTFVKKQSGGIKTELHGKYRLVKEVLPNKNEIHYQYDEFERVEKVWSTSCDKRVTYANAYLAYDDKTKETKNSNFTLFGNGKKIGRYEFKRPGDGPFHNFFYLEKVYENYKDQGYLLEKFEYDDGEKKRESKKVNGVYYQRGEERGPYIKGFTKDHSKYTLDYYNLDNKNTNGAGIHIKDSTDHRCDKVRQLNANISGKNLGLFNFKYELFPPEGADKYKSVVKTYVTNLENRDKLSFQFFKEKIPTKMDYLFKDLEGEERHYSETYYWVPGSEPRLIDSVLYRDEKNLNSSMTIVYEYEPNGKGNVLRKRVLGNLSGTCALLCEGKCDEYLVAQKKKENPSQKELNSFKKGCSGKCADRCNRENYSTTYTYTQDEFNLPLTKIEDNGLATKYNYVEGSNLLQLKIIYDKNTDIAFEREFYFYNDDYVLVKKIVDDGQSIRDELIDDPTANVKKITIITPKKSNPAINFPKLVEEYYEEKGNLVLLGKKEFIYNDEAEVIAEIVYDCQNKHCYTLTYQYAENGLLLSKTDPLARKTKYTHDTQKKFISHRVRSIKEDTKRFTEEFSYDFSGNIKEKTLKGVDNTRTHSYENTLLGSKKSESDFRGNITTFSSNGRGQVTQKELSTISDDPIIFKTFHDAFGNVVKTIDAMGNETHRKYNSYGSVTEIIYPAINGKSPTERFIYYLNGLLKTHINQEGTETTYTYDVLGRELTKTISDKDEELVLETHEYEGSLLKVFTDAEGNETYYYYDGAGRKIAEDKIDSVTLEVYRIEFGYDTLGRLNSEKICNGDQSLITITEKDFLGRDILIYQKDLQGKTLSKKAFIYHENSDNLKQEIAYIDDQKTIITSYEYDEFDRVISITDNDNNQTTTVYEDDYLNGTGQRVLQKTITNPLGLETIEEYDTLDQLVHIDKSKDILLSSDSMKYDKNGNLSAYLSDVIVDGETLYQTVREYKYDSLNRPTRMIEAVGTALERQTLYEYTDIGQLFKTTKPDGIVLSRRFDKLGNEISLTSSDHTIDYEYEYNLLGQLTKSLDGVNQTQTKRELSGLGYLLSETLANGLKIEYEYDFMGRVVKTTLPDKSTIEKEYDALNLLKVLRKSANGKVTYIHKYTGYDLLGNLQREEVLGSKTIEYFYDSLGRIKSINSEFFSHKIHEYDPLGKILSMQINDEPVRTFSYNDLEQLVEEKGLYNDQFSYDSNFNRREKNGKCYAINSLNQIETAEDTFFSYDKNGNTLSKSSDTDVKYTYDALDRLVKVEIDGKDPIFYEYDSLHRRIKKYKNKETHYLYQGDNEIGEYVDNYPKTLRVLGNTFTAEMGSSLLFEIDGHHYIPIHDATRNVACLLDHKGKLNEEYRYSSFGQESIKIHDLTWDFDEDLLKQVFRKETINPWRFQSKRTDPETGYVYFGRRYYDPEIGRWITTDPKSYEEGVNLYAYVVNCPLTVLDLYGLSPYVIGVNIPREYQTSFSEQLNVLKSYGSFMVHNTTNEIAEYCSIFPLIFDGMQYMTDGNLPDFLDFNANEFSDLVGKAHKATDKIFQTALSDKCSFESYMKHREQMSYCTMPSPRTFNPFKWLKNLFGVRQASKSAYEIAKNGGKHHTFLMNYSKIPNKQIKKAIKSYQKQVRIHEDKIFNPRKYCNEWEYLHPKQKTALINKTWPNEIKRFREQVNILEGILSNKK